MSDIGIGYLEKILVASWKEFRENIDPNYVESEMDIVCWLFHFCIKHLEKDALMKDWKDYVHANVTLLKKLKEKRTKGMNLIDITLGELCIDEKNDWYTVPVIVETKAKHRRTAAILKKDILKIARLLDIGVVKVGYLAYVSLEREENFGEWRDECNEKYPELSFELLTDPRDTREFIMRLTEK